MSVTPRCNAVSTSLLRGLCSIHPLKAEQLRLKPLDFWCMSSVVFAVKRCTLPRMSYNPLYKLLKTCRNPRYRFTVPRNLWEDRLDSGSAPLYRYSLESSHNRWNTRFMFLPLPALSTYFVPNVPQLLVHLSGSSMRCAQCLRHADHCLIW